MKIRTNRCSCGQLQVTVRGEPVRISICHCLECQRRTGSVYGVQARFPRDAVSVEGNSSEYRRVAESGHGVSMHFCPECGSTVYYFLDQVPGFVGVPVGGFADAEFPAPTISIYESYRHHWVQVPNDIERCD
jgi:hypothetical protein